MIFDVALHRACDGIFKKAGKISPRCSAVAGALGVQFEKSLDCEVQNGLVNQPELAHEFGQLVPLSPPRFPMFDGGFHGSFLSLGAGFGDEILDKISEELWKMIDQFLVRKRMRAWY